METKKKFPWWVVILIVVVLCVFCVMIIAAGMIAIPWFTQKAQSPVLDIVQDIVPDLTLPYDFNTVPDVTDTFDPGTSSMQISEDTYLYDDFSSDALGWAVANDDLSILKYENGMYSFQILKADETDWVYPPIEFQATDIWFDVQGLPGDQNGTFGVFCQDQDIDNYYFVEFDLELRSYLVGVVTNNEFTYLTPENSDGNYWVDSNAIQPKPEQINRIGINCYLDFISVYINDEWVNDFDIPNPFATEGSIALYVYAYDFAGADGYKVFFDNVEIY